MAGTAPAAGPTAGELRRRAADIVAGYRHGRAAPRPLAGLLHAIGRGLEAVFGPVGRFLERYLLHPIASGSHVAFGPWWPVPVIILAASVGIGTAIVLARRRTRVRTARVTVGQSPGSTAEDPGALEGQAVAAEAAGRYGDAVRLRFRAGLARLERDGAVAHREILTGRQLADTLGSDAFADLAGQHEEIAFGGRPATVADAADARARWPRVREEVRPVHVGLGSGRREATSEAAP